MLKLDTSRLHPEIKCVTNYFKFPYINGLTQKIRRIIEDEEHKIAVYNSHTTNILFSKLKDKVETKDKTNVIYQIPCAECDGVYIGQTKQNLDKRIKQHKNDSKIRSNFDKTALTKHIFELNHNFDFDNVSILDVEPIKFKRNISEMVQIYKNKNSVNERTDTKNLNKYYISLLNIEANKY